MATVHGPGIRQRRSGFSLLEILIVLAIFALGAALIMPSLSRLLDQATAHAAVFELQSQVSGLRREANRTGLALRIVDADAPMPADDDGTIRKINLRAPWTYRLAPSLDIAAGGACSPATVNLIRQGQVVLTLRSVGRECRFSRSPTGAALRHGSSSR